MPLPPAQWQNELVLDSILTTSMMNYMPELQEHILTNNFYYFWLWSRDRIRTMDGGESIVVPLLYGLNETVKSYSDYEGLDVSPQDGMTSARYQWKQISGSISISRKEERANSSKSRIISLMEAKSEQLEMSYQEKLGAMIYLDGTGNSGKDLLGLEALVETGPTFGTLAGIDAQANTWWRPTTLDMATIDAGGNFDGTAGAGKAEGDVINGQTAVRKLYRMATRGRQQPDLILTHGDTYDQYEAGLAYNQRHVDVDTASHGFMNIKVRNAVMAWEDDYITDGAGVPGQVGLMYMLNSKFLKVIIDTQTNFLQTPFIRPHDQDARSAHTLLMANNVVLNRQRQAVLYGIT